MKFKTAYLSAAIVMAAGAALAATLDFEGVFTAPT
jgi:hypothetical protein